MIARRKIEGLLLVHDHQFLFHDRDSKFGETVGTAMAAIGLKPIRTCFRNPWQNGVPERWVASCRRELLDHVIPFNERRLKRLLSEYIRYYHLDRTHLGLEKDTPNPRARAEQKVPCERCGFNFGETQLQDDKAWLQLQSPKQS